MRRALVLIDIVGSTAFMAQRGNETAMRMFAQSLDVIEAALRVVDPTLERRLSEGGDSREFVGANTAALILAAKEFQEGQVGADLRLRVVIGEGEVSEDAGGLHGSELNRMGRLKSACRPGGLVVTYAAWLSLQVAGQGHRLVRQMLALRDLPDEPYFSSDVRGYFDEGTPVVDEREQGKLIATMEAMQRWATGHDAKDETRFQDVQHRIEQVQVKLHEDFQKASEEARSSFRRLYEKFDALKVTVEARRGSDLFIRYLAIPAGAIALMFLGSALHAWKVF